MYKRIDFTLLEGLLYTQELLAFLQSSYRDSIGGLARLAGPLVIVAGVADEGADWGDGWVCIDGELLPFQGGLKADRIIIDEVIEQEEYSDGNNKDAYYTRIAKLASTGGNAFSSFVRLDTIATLQSRIAALEAKNQDTIQFIVDGGGAVITTGQKGHIEVPFNCTVVGWTIFANTSGSIVVDIWKDTYANFPPTSGDAITGSQKPTLAAAVKNENNNPNTWTTALAKGDILAFNVDSVTTIGRATVVLKVTRQ